MLIVALLSGMLAFLLFLILIEYFTRGKTKISRKVRRYTETMSGMDYVDKKSDSIEKFMKFIRYMGLKVRATPRTKVLEIKMQQAGLPLLGSEFLVIMAVAALVFGILGMLFTLKILYATLLGICAPIVCFLYLNIRIARRRVEFSNQLGDALSMMSNAMRSGFSFMQAMDLIAKEMKPPISVEFFKTIA